MARFLVNDTSCKLYLNNELYPYIYLYHSLFNNNELLHFNSDIGDLVIEYFPENKIYHIKYEHLLKLNKTDYNIIGFIVCPASYDIYGTGEYLVQSSKLNGLYTVSNDWALMERLSIRPTGAILTYVYTRVREGDSIICQYPAEDYDACILYRVDGLKYSTNAKYLIENVIDVVQKYGYIPYEHLYYPEGPTATTAYIKYIETYDNSTNIPFPVYDCLLSSGTTLTTHNEWFLPTIGEFCWATLYLNILYNFYITKIRLNGNSTLSLQASTIYVIGNYWYNTNMAPKLRYYKAYLSTGLINQGSNAAYNNVVLFTKGKWPEFII